MVVCNSRMAALRTVAGAVVAIAVITAMGCDMTPTKIEKTVKDAGTTDEQVDKVMHDFKGQ